MSIYETIFGNNKTAAQDDLFTQAEAPVEFSEFKVVLTEPTPLEVYEASDTINAGDSVECPCCTRNLKIYKKPLCAGWAVDLIRLYRLAGVGEYLHIKHWVENGRGHALMKEWGLIEEMPKGTGGEKKKTSGCWCVTPKGEKFIQRQTKIHARLTVYLGEVVGVSEDMVDIDECLGKDFDYYQLMSNTL